MAVANHLNQDGPLARALSNWGRDALQRAGVSATKSLRVFTGASVIAFGGFVGGLITGAYSEPHSDLALVELVLWIAGLISGSVAFAAGILLIDRFDKGRKIRAWMQRLSQ